MKKGTIEPVANVPVLFFLAQANWIRLTSFHQLRVDVVISYSSDSR